MTALLSEIHEVTARIAALTSIRRTRSHDVERATINGNGDLDRNVTRAVAELRKVANDLEKTVL